MDNNNEYFEEEVIEAEYVEPKKKDWLLPVSILIAGVMISGSLIYMVGSNSSGQKQKSQTIVLGDNPPPSPSGELPPVGGRDVILGDAKAPVTLIEYGDYQCPFCGRFFHEVEPPLRDEYIKTGKVKMVFRNFQFLGPESIASGAAAECAKDQSKFWAYRDAIYTAETADGHENSGNLNRDLFLMLAQNAGLDMTTFTSCLDSNKYAERVNKDTADGQTLGVNSTPTVYINGEKVIGAQPYSVFKNVIDIALQKK